LSKFRAGPRSLRGLRLIRTQLHDQPLSQESLTDLAYLRLDLFGALSVTSTGNPGMIYLAHLLPPNGTGQLCNVFKCTPFQQQTLGFDQFIEELETDMQRARGSHAIEHDGESAVLVSASSRSRFEQEERLVELTELASSAGVTVIDRIAQRTP